MAYRSKSRWRAGRSFSKRVVRAVTDFAEKKTHSNEDIYTLGFHEVDWSGRHIDLTQIAAGTGRNQRAGRMIQVMGIMWRFQVYRDSNENAARAFTFAIVQDTQQDPDTEPAVSSIFTGTGGIGAGLGCLDQNNRGRYKLLKRETIMFSDAQSGNGNNHLFDGYLDLSRKPIRMSYNGTGADDIAKNGLYIIMISDGDPANDEIKANGLARITYVDI